MTFGNPAFCLALYLTGVHFRGELQHVCHVGQVSTNQNSRNRWCQIAGGTICWLQFHVIPISYRRCPYYSLYRSI